MARAPTYLSQSAAPQAPALTVQPQDVPNLAGAGAAIGEAAADLGRAGQGFAVALENAQQDTRVAQARTRALTEIDALETKFARDPDFQNAPQNFGTEIARMKGEVMKDLRVGPEKTAEFETWFARSQLPAAGHVRKAALGLEQSTNRAGLIERGVAYENRAVNAASPVERAAVMKEWENDIDGVAASLWISPAEAANMKLQAGRGLARADLLRQIRENPEGAYASLADANNYPLLDADERERYRTAAGSAADQLKIDRLHLQAETDPAAARAQLDDTEFAAPHSRYRALTTIASAATAARTRADHAARVAASTDRSNDPVLDLIRERYPVDDGRIAEALRKADAAAATGDLKSAEYARDIREQLALKPVIDEAYARPPAVNAAELAQVEAAVRSGKDTSPETYRRLTALKAVNAEIADKKDREPVALFERAYPRAGAVVIDPRATPEEPGFAAALAHRGQQALRAQSLWLGSAKPFKAQEAVALKERMAQAGSGERAAMIGAFARNLPRGVYDEAIEQVFGKDNVTAFAGRVMIERPTLAREILDGQALIKAQGEKQGGDVLRSALAVTVGGDLYPSAQMQDSVVRAAEAVAVARAGRANALYETPDQSLREKAIEDITGPIVTRNGVRVPLPPMLGRGRALDVIDNLSEDDVAFSGGAIDARGNVLPARTISRHAQLKPLQVGGSRYAVLMPSADGRGHPVLDQDGRPLVLDLAWLASRKQPARAAAGESGMAP